MNLCIVSENFEIGGAQKVAKFVGTELAKYHKVFFISLGGNRNPYAINENMFYSTNNRSNSKIKKSFKLMETILRLGQHNPVRYRRKDVAYLIDFIKSNKIEVLILNQGSITMFAQIIKGLFPKIKIICWLHNNYDTYMNHYFKYANKQLITSLQISDGIICLTKKDQEMFSKFNDNTLCIYNPLTIEPSGISKLNEKVISFTSRISFQHKGIDILVEVAKKIPEGWIIRVAGPGSEEETEKFQKLIIQNKVSDKIHYVGPKNGMELDQHFLTSSIFLSTSRWEGMPLVLIEAMSYGLPIVSFDNSGAIEITENGYYGKLIKNLDSRDMINALTKIIRDKNLRTTMQEDSLKRSKIFEIENIGKEWLSCIEKL